MSSNPAAHVQRFSSPREWRETGSSRFESEKAGDGRMAGRVYRPRLASTASSSNESRITCQPRPGPHQWTWHTASNPYANMPTPASPPMSAASSSCSATARTSAPASWPRRGYVQAQHPRLSSNRLQNHLPFSRNSVPSAAPRRRSTSSSASSPSPAVPATKRMQRDAEAPSSFFTI